MELQKNFQKISVLEVSFLVDTPFIVIVCYSFRRNHDNFGLRQDFVIDRFHFYWFYCIFYPKEFNTYVFVLENQVQSTKSKRIETRTKKY